MKREQASPDLKRDKVKDIRPERHYTNNTPRPHFLITALMMMNVSPVCVHVCVYRHALYSLRMRVAASFKSYL